jgi:hypothetical protein
VKQNNHPVEGPDGLVYTARLPLSSATLNYLATLIRGHCKKIGSRWRALPAGIRTSVRILRVETGLVGLGMGWPLVDPTPFLLSAGLGSFRWVGQRTPGGGLFAQCPGIVADAGDGVSDGGVHPYRDREAGAQRSAGIDRVGQRLPASPVRPLALQALEVRVILS